MSEENKDFKEKASDALENAKEATKDFAEDAKETVNEFTDNFNKATSNGENKKVLSGILAILLGCFGIHKFVLGYNKEGIIMLACSLVLGFITCGIGASVVGIIGLVEGIIYLTKSDEEFYQTYQVGRKGWF